MIKEVTSSQEVKPIENSQADNQSGDSGLASSSNNSIDNSSGTHINKSSRCLIIQFQALNAGAQQGTVPKESTFMLNNHGKDEACNVSRIDGSKNRETLNSEDGKPAYDSINKFIERTLNKLYSRLLGQQ